MSYLKDKAKNLKVFTKEFNIALFLIFLIGLGTYFEVPPFSSILGLSESIKDDAAEKYDEPPYGHAELSSLKTFAKKMGINLKESMKLLKEAGFTVEGETQTLSAIGKLNDISPQQIYLTIKPSGSKSATYSVVAKKLPDSPPTGTGKMTLADLCSQYNLNMKIILRAFAKENITASADLTIKKISEENQIGPTDLYERIKIIASTNSKEL